MSRESVDHSGEGADVKRATLLLAIGCAAALTGCRACWIDRADERPLTYGSLHDKLSYSVDGPSEYRPCYHGGPVDGLRDWKAVRHAAISSANQTLSEQFYDEISRDFKYGFQQAFIDVGNGGNGALPAIPPSRYWSAPYRTTWGHTKARHWFEGYQAGASTAKCCAMREAQTIATSAYRTNDQRTAIGFDGAASPVSPITSSWPSHVSASLIPMSAPMSGWNQGGGWNPYSSNPYSNPYPMMSPPNPSNSPNPPGNPAGVVAPSLPPAPQSVDGGGHSVAPEMTSAPAADPISTTDNPGDRFVGFGTSGIDSTAEQNFIPPAPASAAEAATPSTTETSDPSSQFADPDGEASDSQGESR